MLSLPKNGSLLRNFVMFKNVIKFLGSKPCNVKGKKSNDDVFITLNNGNKMPKLGVGTWTEWSSTPGQVTEAVSHAIDAGYRHIDCAHVYKTEKEVGAAITAKIKEGKVKREELFVTSKLWNTFHRPDLVCGACEKSLKDLNLEYLDMYLIHWPMAYKEGGDFFPKDACDKLIFSKVNYLDTWKAMEELVSAKLCKSIGVSNFNKRQLECILSQCKILPANNQVECHPYLNQKRLMEFCKTKKIAITGYSPLGSPNRPWKKPEDPELLKDERIIEIAKSNKMTTPQVLIRYQIQRGNAAIPKALIKSQIQSNFKVFDFKLSPEDIKCLDSLDINARYVSFDLPCAAIPWPDFEICLNNGNKMPVLGLGTWNMTQCQVYKAVTNAIDVGYRHIDCAHIHENEHGVGKALSKKMIDCVIKREDLFVTSKLWNTFHRPNLVKDACEKSLKDLGLSYLDMYLMQWPMAYEEGGELLPYDKNGKIKFSCIDYIDTWRAMEALVNLGYCKSIGVSNFNMSQLERLLNSVRLRPATNQVECHPYLKQNELMKYCKSKDIVITAYSPLGSPCRPWIKCDEPVLLEDKALILLARRYRKTPAQISLRYQVQRGNAAIPKARFRDYIEENIDIFDFFLTADDMEYIDESQCNGRYISLDFQAAGHIHYPFKDELIEKQDEINQQCCAPKSEISYCEYKATKEYLKQKFKPKETRCCFKICK